MEHGEGQGDADKTHSYGKLMPLAGSYMVQEGSLQRDLKGVTTTSGDIGQAR